jgi:hypothetical protein
MIKKWNSAKANPVYTTAKMVPSPWTFKVQSRMLHVGLMVDTVEQGPYYFQQLFFPCSIKFHWSFIFSCNVCDMCSFGPHSGSCLCTETWLDLDYQIDTYHKKHWNAWWGPHKSQET